MILLLIIVSSIGALALVASAFETLGRATSTDGASRGTWGVIEWHWSRERAMSSHELRWHTALTAGRAKANRWPELVAELEQLERSAEIAHDPNPPAEFDPTWIDDRLNQLERHLGERRHRTAPLLPSTLPGATE